jgi:hypothetical protein
MWNNHARRSPFRAANWIAGFGLAALTLLPLSAQAATVFVQVSQNDSGHALCDVLCGQVVGNGPQTLGPVAVSDTQGSFINGFGSVTATEMKMSSATNAAGGVSMGLSDTFTVHGAGTGPVSLTAVWHATGTVGTVAHSSTNIMLGATQIRIGTLGSFVVSGDTLYNVASFSGPDTSKVSAPSIVSGIAQTFAIDMTAKYIFTADIGSSFDMAFALTSGFTFGQADFTHTATLSFDTGAGIYLTSGLGGTFGDAPSAVATPVPAAMPLFAGGLGLLAVFARRRRRIAAAA